MTKRVFSFNPGAAVLPLEVLETAQSELLDFKGTGMSVMEISHRSKEFEIVIQTAEADLREPLASLLTIRLCSCRVAPLCNSPCCP